MNQAIAAGKRGDYAAQEKFLKKELALDFDGMVAGNLLRMQEKRGEYADALVTMREIMNPIDPAHNPGNPEVPGRYSAGPPNVSRFSSQMGSLNYLLRYEKLCDKVGAKEEGAIVWGRVIDSLNRSGIWGKELPFMAGRKLTQSQMQIMAEAAVALSNEHITHSKRISTARAVLAAVPQCDPARRLLADDAFDARYSDGTGTPHVREAERQYKILVHSSDAAIRKDAETNLREITGFRAEAAKWVPAAEELDYAYARNYLPRFVNKQNVTAP